MPMARHEPEYGNYVAIHKDLQSLDCGYRALLPRGLHKLRTARIRVEQRKGTQDERRESPVPRNLGR
jgi:hypothetical protein